MSFNFGGFAGGMAGGIERGLRIGKEMEALKKQRDVRNLIQQGLAEKEAADQVAKAAGASKVEEGPATEGQAYRSETGSTVTPIQQGNVETRALPPMDAPSVSAPTPNLGASSEGNAGEAEARAAMTAPAAPVAQPTPQAAASTGLQAGQFYDGDKKFATRAEAAESATGPVMSKDAYLVKSIYPKVRDYYLAQGDLEGAEKFDKYAKSKRGEAVNAAWAKVVTAPDLETAAKHARDLYEYVDDGITTTGHKIITKSDGTQVAMVTMKDKATGKTSEMELTQDKIMQLAGMANPQKMYEDYRTQQSAAEKLKAERVIKREDRAYTRETELIKQEGSDKREAARLDAQAVRDDKRADQRVNEIELKARLDADNAAKFKKATDPMERRALIRSDAMKNDTKFPRMSLEEQNKYLDDAMESIQGKQVKEEAAKPPTGNVTIETKPMPYKEGAPVKYNKADGKPYHLIDGKYIPIEGGVVPKKPAEPAAPAAPTVKAPGPKSGMPVNPGFTSKF